MQKNAMTNQSNLAIFLAKPDKLFLDLSCYIYRTIYSKGWQELS